jgi:tRNA/rRNA methyltransferase
MITIILAEPEHPGNIGSVCRVMANFACKDLILINPKCQITQESRNLAKNAQSILNNARIADWSVLKEFRVVGATTGTIGSDYNLIRTPLTPEQGASKLRQAKQAALLFGRESDGLSNVELQKADFVITIPTHHKYTSMNLSHAVAVMLYMYYITEPTKQFNPISEREKQVLHAKLKNVLEAMPFPTESKRLTQEKLWKNIFGRAMLTRREAFAALGFLSVLEKQQTPKPASATKQTQQTKLRSKQPQPKSKAKQGSQARRSRKA